MGPISFSPESDLYLYLFSDEQNTVEVTVLLWRLGGETSQLPCVGSSLLSLALGEDGGRSGDIHEKG